MESCIPSFLELHNTQKITSHVLKAIKNRYWKHNGYFIALGKMSTVVTG